MFHEPLVDEVGVVAIISVERDLVKAGCGEVVRWGITVLRSDGREDQPLRTGDGVVAFQGATIVVARDLGVAQQRQQ